MKHLVVLSIVFLLFACNTWKTQTIPPGKVDSGARTLWEVCWDDDGTMDLPSDTPPHTPKCKSWEYLVWPRGHVRIAMETEHEQVSRHLDVAIEQWNRWIGYEFFVRTALAYDVLLLVLPENDWIYGMAVPMKEADVLIGAVFVYGYYETRCYHTILHELGHILGIAHDVDNRGYLMDKLGNSTMIAPEDIRAIRELYKDHL